MLIGGGEGRDLSVGVVRKENKCSTKKAKWLKGDFFTLFFLAGLGLHCFMGLSLAEERGGYPLAVEHGLLMAVASLTEEHRVLGRSGFSVAVPGL